MLLKMGVLIVLVLASFIFLGIKMSENIKQQEIKMLFFALYGMTIFTIFNLVISVYFFTALRHKRGPAGPKGKKGELGDKGTNSACDQPSCLRKSLQNIIVKQLESDQNPPISLTGKQRTMICSLNKQLSEQNLQKLVVPPSKIQAIISKLNEIDADTNDSKFKNKMVDIAVVLGNTTLSRDKIQDTFCN